MTNKTIIVGFIALAFVAGTFGVQSAYAGVDPILQLQMAAVELRNAVLQNAQVIEGEIGARILNDQNQQEQIDSFFDVFVDAGELFQEVSDRQAADDALRTHIDTEIVALDLRGSSCDVNNVVTGVDIDGNLVCLPDTDSNAGTICISGQYLDGDGTCKVIPIGGSSQQLVKTIRNLGDTTTSCVFDREVPILPGVSVDQYFCTASCLADEVGLVAENQEGAEDRIFMVDGNEFTGLSTTLSGLGPESIESNAVRITCLSTSP